MKGPRNRSASVFDSDLRGSRRTAGILALATVLALAPKVAPAQAMLADDVIILSKGQRARQAARTGPGAVSGAPSPLPSPGSAASRLGGGLGTMKPESPARLDSSGILSAASGYNTAFTGRAERPMIVAPPPLPNPGIPQFGALELPGPEDEGPANGLTLDAALGQLLMTNPDLLAKAREIPKSRADAVTAGLIANPIIFFSADSVPYGTYSPQRPGNNSYGIVAVQPIDVNGKRRARVIVAEQAQRVTEAMYQDAVRLAIDVLGAAFINVLEARETVRFKEANLARLEQMVGVARELLRKSTQRRPDLDRTAILRDAAEVELQATRAALVNAKRTLATLLNCPPAEGEALAVRGTIHDIAPPPPPVDDLVRMALCTRPDVVAYRLGVQRARADYNLTRRERFEDVFLFYTPYGFANYAYEHEKSATSWSLGGLVSIPLFNRNQGNIARASEGVAQAQIELTAVERRAIDEVQRAALEYQTTADAVRRLEQSILPRGRRMRDDNYKLYVNGEQDITAYFNAERDYNDILRQYRDSLILHRRSMLRINTAVGQRILP